MKNELSPAAQRVQDALSDAGFACTVTELTVSARTAVEAAEAVGCHLGQIVKSLVFRGKDSGAGILALVSGANLLDEEKLAPLAGEPVEKPGAAFVRETTGFAIGGIPPLGHAQPLRAFIDADLLCYPELWAAAGTPHALFRLAPQELAAMTGGIAADLKR
jgi:prolyl-tRNA editing enzyme YbaK/EbsC (Cys-tRNA(Pro) deacylase)